MGIANEFLSRHYIDKYLESYSHIGSEFYVK